MNQSDTQRTDSGNESVFDSFRVSLEKRILNYNYKQQIVFACQFVSSLEVTSLTFSSILNSEMVSEEKMAKVRVIGKAYYETLNQ